MKKKRISGSNTNKDDSEEKEENVEKEHKNGIEKNYVTETLVVSPEGEAFVMTNRHSPLSAYSPVCLAGERVRKMRRGECLISSGYQRVVCRTDVNDDLYNIDNREYAWHAPYGSFIWAPFQDPIADSSSDVPIPQSVTATITSTIRNDAFPDSQTPNKITTVIEGETLPSYSKVYGTVRT